MNRSVSCLLALALLVGISSQSFGATEEPAAAASFRPYPLINGHFYYSSWDRPNDWDSHTAVGSARFTIEPPPADVWWRSLEVMWKDFFPAVCIVAEGHAKACYRQDTPLMPGRYRLSVDVHLTKGAQGRVVIDGEGKTVAGTDGWQRVSVEFGLEQGKAVAIGLWLKSGDSGGTVKFKKATIEILRLASSPVPLAGGAVLGAVVIPDSPDPAEEYAAYELQKYIYKMTGLVVGLQGRDEVVDGQVLAVGGPAPEQLKDLSDDSYAIDVAGGKIMLCGKRPVGTLYATYDFLKLQGCGWYWPGRWGEVVPQRGSLTLPAGSSVQSPDYDVRSIHVSPGRQGTDNVMRWVRVEDYMDWAVRNRMNGFWAQWRPMDFGRHRGTGHLQTTNHSWWRWRVDAHPEWWPLVNGKRMKQNEGGRGNQLCVSNQALRDQVVKDVLEHFKAHPLDKMFGLNPDDAHVYWCECAGCRALDEDEGKGEWHFRRERKGFETWAAWPELSMTDRVIDFANEVAERVSRVYPDKLIEAYAYAEFIQPPKRRRVHPNVQVKYCFQPSWPLNKPVSEETNFTNNVYLGDVIACLDGWKKAGAKHIALYDYYNYGRTECPMFSFYNVADYTRVFHRRWGFRYYMGQTESSFLPSMMMFNVHARLLWDTNTRYKDVIDQVCRAFYGPAAKTMIQYYLFMDQLIMNGKKPTWLVLDSGEFDLGIMNQARSLLERAKKQVAGDAVLEARIDVARFGQANLTYSLAKNIKPGAGLSPAQRRAGREAFDLSNALRRKHDLTVGGGDASHLTNFYLPPAVEKTLHRLPSKWRFKTDPQDVGEKQNWPSAEIDQGWQEISVEKDWRSQGHDYYGVAWYAIGFSIPDDARGELGGANDRLALLFGAVDGLADVYLDGKKIGEQKKPLEIMWNRPFKIALPGDFDPAADHTLVVRVRKDSMLAGIWRPVSIVRVK